MMELEDFRKQFISDIRSDAEYEGTDPENKFIEQALIKLEELGEIQEFNPQSVEIRGQRNKLLAFDAYAYDNADGAIVLILSDFSNRIETSQNLTNSRIDELFARMQNFIDEAVNGNIRKYCDDSDPAITVADEFRKKIGKGMVSSEIMRFKFIIISDAILSKAVKDISKPDFLGRPVNLNVWTIERFFNTYISNTSEIIEIETKDFGFPDGIPVLKADLDSQNKYDAYLGILPGEFLAKIYYKYGSKLLQGNVRAFLSVRGKVNKGIRETIIKHPENFFTFNNGVAIIARQIKMSPDNSHIVYFKDFQIINGGQTTASLTNSLLIKNEAQNGMDSIFVQMKLTVLNVEDDMSEEQQRQYAEMTKTISQCANSQNAVSEADFFSNHPFHIEMETLSRKVLAPPINGKPYQTIWFYERSRGKWDQEQMKMKESEKLKFKDKNPKNQVVKKEKLAKCYNAILKNPHQVCKSSAENFKVFAPFIDKLYDNNRDAINDEFFKKCVCSIIIFDGLDDLVNKSSWYPKGGNKAQIVPYAISKMMDLIPNGKDLDWVSIWQKQKLYPELATELLNIAKCAHEFLMEKANGGIVRTISRNASVWEDFRKYPYELSKPFLNKLISKEEIKVSEHAAKRAHKFNSNIDISVEVFKLGSEYWLKVYNDLNGQGVLSYGDCTFIKGIADYISRGNLPTPPQCKRLKKIINDAEDKGYIMPES